MRKAAPLTSENKYDILVIGAGVGGICAATLLADRGYRMLLVERLDRVGGRASTTEIDGFLVNTGAAACEFGGSLERVFDTVAVPYGADTQMGRGVRVPRRRVVTKLGALSVNLTPFVGGWASGALRWFCRVSLERLPRVAAKRGVGPDELTFEQWLNRLTTNKRLHSMLRSPLGSFFVTDESELPAAAVFTYFSQKTGLRRFGFHPKGTIGVSQALTDRFTELGGTLWTSAEVHSVRIDNGLVAGAVIGHDGVEVEIDCAAAISDAGPRATVDLVGREHFPEQYLRQVDDVRSGALIAVNFATRSPWKRFGAMTFGPTKNGRLIELINFTATCPEMAPEGWHLYLGWGLPQRVDDDFDSELESDLLLEDLRAAIPGFDQARILSVSVCRDNWPGQHAMPGTDIGPETPIANLWNVGDGVKDFGDGGMEAVAKVACDVVDSIVHRAPVLSDSES